MIPRNIYSDEHKLFRNQVRRLLHYGTEEQKTRWLPPMTTGEVIVALGMSEPSGGSDVAAKVGPSSRTAGCAWADSSL